MAWVSPRTWVTSEVVTSALLNTHIRDNENALNSSLSGDNEPTVPHQHKSGTYANIPAAATAGRLYVATDLGPAVFMDTGTTWVLLAAPPRITEYFFDDFIADVGLGWIKTVSGSGGFTSGTGNSSLQTLSTGGTNSSLSLLTPAANNSVFTSITASRLPAIFEAKAYLKSATQSDYQIGLRDTWGIGIGYGGDASNEVLFRRRSTTSGVNLFSVTRSGGVETGSAIDLGVGNDALAHALRIEILSTASIRFYVDDVLKATHTINIPTANMGFGLSVGNNEAVAKTMDVDYVSWLAKRL